MPAPTPTSARSLPGKRADLLLVDGDPTADILATQDIRQVFQNGIQLERRPR